MDLTGLFARHLELPPPETTLDRGALPAGGGVCALTDSRGELILTLAAQNLRRSLGLRLDPPADAPRRGRPDLRAVARRLWWQPTYSTFETSLTYLGIARQLSPGKYHKDLAFGPVWFARVNPQDRFPRWVADRFAFTPPTVDVGPFVDRSSCRRFIELLEDLFDLCRYHQILRQAPQGQACAYKEMGRCPAPCDGTVSMDRYREAIGASIEFARGASDNRLSQLELEMGEVARRLDFEGAAGIRERLARAGRLLADDGRLQPTPDTFRYLVIQRAGGTSQVKPFFVNRGSLQCGEPIGLGAVERAAAEWTDNMRRPLGATDDTSPTHRSEHIWVVSHYLIKRERAPGLFLHQRQITTPQELARKVIGLLDKTHKRPPERTNCIDRAPARPVE